MDQHCRGVVKALCFCFFILLASIPAHANSFVDEHGGRRITVTYVPTGCATGKDCGSVRPFSASFTVTKAGFFVDREGSHRLGQTFKDSSNNFTTWTGQGPNILVGYSRWGDGSGYNKVTFDLSGGSCTATYSRNKYFASATCSASGQSASASGREKQKNKTKADNTDPTDPRKCVHEVSRSKRKYKPYTIVKVRTLNTGRCDQPRVCGWKYDNAHYGTTADFAVAIAKSAKLSDMITEDCK